MSYKKATVSNVSMSELNPPFKTVNAMSAANGYVGAPAHTHSIYHLNYIFDGSLTISFKGETYQVTKGMAFILPPDIPHSIYTEKEYSQMGIDFFNIPDNRGLLKLLDSVCSNECKICKISEFSATFSEMHKIISNPTAFNHILAEHKAEEILLKAITAINKESKTSFEENFIEAIKKIKGTPTLDKICQLTGYSRVHTERLAKTHFGCGAIEYINRLKINRICSFLTNTDMPISAIAEKEGFYDTAHLTVFFKKRMGITPSKYRK